MSLQEGWFNVQSCICLISGWFDIDAVHALCTDSDGVKVFLVCILVIIFDAIYNNNAGLIFAFVVFHWIGVALVSVACS